jgi:hypothetical protein
MSQIFLAITISILFLVFYILLTFWYRLYLSKFEMVKDQTKLDTQIDKYIPEEKRNEMREKLDQISNIIRETEKSLEQEIEKKVKAAKSQDRLVVDESLIIEQAKKEYLIHSADFSSAMPKTEEELQADMENLKESIDTLESLDKEYYLTEPKKADVGTGMFYDKITRKFQQIIEEQQLLKYKIIPIQRLKYHAIKEIKNIRDEDFLPILNLMKETELITDLIEINPKFYIIILSKEKYEFSNPEKVILTFAYDEENLTIEDLLEKTEWDFSYASKVLNELFSKELASITDERIIIEGFGSEEERIKWNMSISKFDEENRLRKEEKKKKKEAFKLHLHDKLKDVEEEAIIKEEKEEKKDYIIESEKDLKPDVEESPQIKFKSKPQVKNIAELKKIRAIYEESPEEISESDLKKLVSQTILSFHEKYSLLNGGLVQYEKLSNFIKGDIEDATEDLIQETIAKLNELKMIHNIFKLMDHQFLTFKEINLKKSEKDFISFALDKKPMNKEDFIKGLSWDEEKVLSIMKDLQSKGILRIERNNIIFPGIIQKG